MWLVDTNIALAADPEGTISLADCTTISGWARDADSKKAVRVIVYRGTDNGANSTFLFAKKATRRLKDLPFSDKSHGFKLSVPGSLRTGDIEKI